MFFLLSRRHIAEDLKQFNIPGNKEFSDMTENELNFLYFKAHDLDGNGKLDGLEMYYSATHHSLSQADHEHEHESEHQQVNGYGDKVVTGKANFRLLSPSGEGKSVDVNFNHVVGKTSAASAIHEEKNYLHVFKFLKQKFWTIFWRWQI